MNIRYYAGNPNDLEGLTRDEVETQTVDDAKDAYAEMLDELYPEVTIGYLTFSASDIVRELDPIAFQCGINDTYTEVDLDDYPEEIEDDEEDGSTFEDGAIILESGEVIYPED